MTLDTKDIDEREKIAKEIARTSESIRKKHRTLKTGRVEQEVQLEKRLKPIVEPLKRIVENIKGDDDSVDDLEIKNEPDIKRKRSSSEKKKKIKRTSLTTPIQTPLTPPVQASTPFQPQKLVFEAPTYLPIENVFETTDPSFATSVRQTMQTSDGREALYGQMGPLGQEYIGELLSGDKKRGIDNVYGVYFNDAGTFLGDKAFDIDRDDNVIVDGVKYAGTPGLFELIFKRLPDDTLCTEADKQKYKSILLATNAHRRGHNAHLPVLGNKGYKYKHIITPLISKKGGGVAHLNKRGAGRTLPKCNVPQTMTVTDNAVDYVHWDDPNELVDRLRLLDASRQAGNNAHDNEFLSIIEELREAGLIIN
ncbi:uncharacterized protein [Linepithema humile]|uniref:uncharacterized protein n=1 Tax=Linepithema humile TaxID=83485 RepID=UPI00351E8E36